RGPGPEELADDGGERRRLALDGAGEGGAAERPESDRAQARRLTGGERQAMVVHQDEGAVALDHRPLGGEIERHDRDALEMDVLPDVELGPVRQGKHADRLPRVLPRVVEAPELGPLVARIPAMVRRAEGEHPLPGPALFLVAP